MATIPVYDAPQVRETALQGGFQQTVNTSAPFGGEQAAQMGEVAKATAGVAQFMQRQQERDDVAKANAAFVALTNEHTNKTLDWQKNRKGSFAEGVSAEADKWWVDAEERFTKDLNDRQRALLAQHAAPMRSRSLASMGQFENQELTTYGIKASTATIGAYISEAARDPNAVDASRQGIRDQIAVLTNLNGWKPQDAQNEYMRYTTTLHTQVMQTIAVNDPDAAKKYFDANKGEISGDKLAEIEKGLETAGIRKKAQTFADDAVGRMSEAQAIAAARKQFEGEAEEGVVAHLKTRYSELTAARERSQRNAADTAWNILEKEGTWTAIPPKVWDSLDGRDRRAIKQAGATVTTDMNTYIELRDKATSDPEGFAKMDLRRYTSKLAKQDMEQLLDLRDKIADPKRAKETITLEKQMDSAIEGLKAEGAKGQELRGKFKKVVYDEIKAAEDANGGKPLNFDARQKIIDRNLIENNSWFGTTRRFQVVGTEREQGFTPKIGDTERTQIKEALKGEGIANPTDAQITARYKLKFGLK